MELLITLGAIGGVALLGALVATGTHFLCYIIAGFKAFPTKTQAIYESLVAHNKEVIEKAKAKKEEKARQKEEKLKEKARQEKEKKEKEFESKAEELIGEVKIEEVEVAKTEDVVEEVKQEEPVEQTNTTEEGIKLPTINDLI